nr:ionotropic receptor 76b [Tropidothorax elegans]
MSFTTVTHYLLLSLCSNYPSPNNGTEGFECKLKSINSKETAKEEFKGKILKIVSYEDYPLSTITEDPGGKLKGGGVVFEIINTLQEKFEFKYELVKGPRNLGDNGTGLLGLLTRGEADMAAAFLPVLPGTHTYITWGTDLWQMTYYVLMKRPEDSASGSGLLAPFNKEVWFLILASLIIVGPTIYFLMWLRLRLCATEDQQLFPMGSCVWFVYGALMKQGSTLTPVSDSARLLFATWWIFILILTAFYTANLTAFLTLSLFTLPIKDISDVANPAHKWFSTTGGSVEYSIKNKDDGDLYLLRESERRGRGEFKDIISDSQILKLISEDWLYLNDQYSLTRLMFEDYKRKTEKGIEESKRCTYVLTENYFLIRSIAFAYPKGSALPAKFNRIIQIFVESGILKHLMNAELPETVICPLNLGNKERKLRNTDLWTTYLVVFSGFTCALIVFCIEIVLRQYNSKKLKRNIHVKGHKNTNYFNKFPFENDFSKALKLQSKSQAGVNGREYYMKGGKESGKTIIPMRTPPALLFQYGFNYPTIL